MLFRSSGRVDRFHRGLDEAHSGFDEIGLMQRVGGDPSLALEVINAYFDDQPERLRELSNALALGDLTQVRRAAHAIKGSSATVGAPAVAAAARALEELAIQGQVPLLELAWRRLQEASTDLEASLRDAVARLGEAETECAR